MNLKRLLQLAIILPLFLNHAYSREYHIQDFGAISDTSKLSTTSIQEAIDECAANGGGQVIIPAGRYKTGSLFFKSNVSLYLEPGAFLYGSKNVKDYRKVKTSFISLRTQDSIVQLIYGENCSNVSICGFGEIDGQGKGFPYKPDDEGITRPHLIRFINCSDVRVENIALKNSACWMQHYLACERVHIHGLRIFNRNMQNNDMLDIDGCNEVTVSDCISDTEDDGITLKSTSGRICENITITNCIVSSRWHAIKLGTESSGGFKNITISNCVIKPTTIYPWLDGSSDDPLNGITLVITDGGFMQNVIISNINIDNSQSPIYIRLANRARAYQRDMKVTNIGTLKDISFDNIRVTNAGNIGCSITGQPGYPVENIRLSNIVIESKGEGTKSDLNKSIPDNPKSYPSPDNWGNLPAYGFFIRHANNITFDGIELRTKNKDLRPAFYLDDVEGAALMNMQIQGAKSNETSILLKQSKDIIIQGNTIKGSSAFFVKAEGDQTSGIRIMNNVIPVPTVIFSAKTECQGGITESCNMK